MQTRLNLRITLVLASVLLLTSTRMSNAQDVNPHDIYDLRIGVERIYDLCSRSPLAYCMFGAQIYRHEVVGNTVEINGEVYSKVFSHFYENAFHMYTDTLYLTVGDGKLWEFKDGEDHILIDFGFTINDSLKHFTSSEYSGIHALVARADTVALFPDAERYRVVFFGGESGLNNAQFVLEMLTADLDETSGYGPIGGWLLPLGDESILQAQPLLVAYYVSRFGFIFALPVRSHPGVQVAFRSHEGQWYGVDPNQFPRSATNIGDRITEFPSQFSVIAYPNPFNPSTTIRFELPSSMEVNLSVYSILGSKVRELVKEQLPAGSHNFVFEAHGLSSGVYIYQINTPLGLRSGKILLIK